MLEAQPEVHPEHKGLKDNSVGLLGSTILSISSVGPACALTAPLASWQGPRPVRRLARRLGRGHGHDHRLVQPGRCRGPVLLSVPGQRLSRRNPRRAVGQHLRQRDHLPGVLAVTTWVTYRGIKMASYHALPARFGVLHEKYRTPIVAVLAAGIGAGTLYTVLTILSENVLTDTILALGILICFYYGLTALGCIWHFRKIRFTSASNFVFKFLLPLLGGLGLFTVLIITLRDSASPDYSSGASLGGVGLVLILGLALIAIGAVVMLIQRMRAPAFFRGETMISDAELREAEFRSAEVPG